ncbi:hypothetical protein HYV86_01650 [Candidatus Woesearchaeota archaeon]|nr:hypothetical protein [Candidatus Woesearchaeota archaeon]
MKKSLYVFLIGLSVFLFGCSSVPDLSESDVATICNIDASSIKKSTSNVGIKFQIPDPVFKGVYTSLFIDIGFISSDEFNQFKQLEGKNVKEYNVGDGSIAYDQVPARTLLVKDGDRAYRVYSLIKNCKSDEKLVQVANKLISGRE